MRRRRCALLLYASLGPGSWLALPAETIANNAVISLSRDGDGSITVRASITGSPGLTDFLIDASGYCQ